MLTCKEVSELLSKSIDEKLPWTTKVSMQIHLGICSLCRSYKKQLLYFHQILEKMDQDGGVDNTAEQQLSEKARKRITLELKKMISKE
jgi:predicted anti-sigma-YlaC factor YlaD